MRIHLAVIAALVSTTSMTAVPLCVEAQAQRWWSDLKALSHDSMRGRETGSPEHRKAAQYVADAFRKAGLTPLGTKAFFQPVRFITRGIDETRSELTLIRSGREERLTLGEDAAFVLRAPLAPRAEAPLVFAGYGLDLPAYGINDLLGLELRGKIVVYMAQVPRGVPGPVISHSRAQAWETFRQHGAVGMIALAGARASDTAFVRQVRNRGAPQMTLADPALDAQRGNRLSLVFNAARAEKLFEGAPATFASIAVKADSGLPLPHFDLPVRLRSRTHLTMSSVSSDNVIGLRRGSDRTLRNEYVVLTAHLDHVGIGRPVNGDSIYNGAMDNASGTALLMETARALQEHNVVHRRSILFVAVTAEEKGLLGSRFYANHPTVGSRLIVANLNTDMFLPLMPAKLIMVNGLEESDLAADARRAGDALGMAIITDPEPEENRFIRSDQYSFILRGIPALSLKVGFRRDSPEHEIVKRFRATRYHLPQDDADQPLDLQAAEDFGRFYLRLVQEVVNRDTRPNWNAESFFRQFAR
ncbi:MAG: M28 family peptidase [Gemmatimonadaceae bacterium]